MLVHQAQQRAEQADAAGAVALLACAACGLLRCSGRGNIRLLRCKQHHAAQGGKLQETMRFTKLYAGAAAREGPR